MESMGERGGYSQGGNYGERGGGSMGYRDENERRREEYEREMYGERRRRWFCGWGLKVPIFQF